MEIKILFFTAIISLFISNYFLPRVVRKPPFFSFLQKPGLTLKAGLAFSFVMIFTSIIYSLVVKHFFTIEFLLLKCIIFNLIIIIFVQLFKTAANRFFPAISQSVNIFFPYLLFNCAFLGTSISLFNIESGFFSFNLFVEAAAHGIGAGLAFTFVLVLISGIIDRLELAEIPSGLMGIPIAILNFVLLALIFYGFSGIRI
ncbi:MAG: Rnf-Nqr domain containing protein [Spirochaetota bacterium]